MGKNMGTVEVWQSPGMHKSSDLAQAITQGQATTLQGTHSTLPVSSVCLRALASQPGTLRLLTAGMDGRLKTWQCSSTEVQHT